ncbi:MAG: hypothetical protein R2911_03205 [Caldilineaceae bacterium]
MNQTSAALHLNFSVQNEQTILRVLKQEPPLRVIRAFPIQISSSAAAAQVAPCVQPVLVHLHNISGGLLGVIVCNWEHVEGSAQAQITSTGSTRVYRQRVGHPTTIQTTQIKVDAAGCSNICPIR